MVGPFSDIQNSVIDFGNSLYFSHLFAESIKRHEELQQEYEKALESNDLEEIANTELQIALHENTFQLTATIFEGADDVVS